MKPSLNPQPCAEEVAALDTNCNSQYFGTKEEDNAVFLFLPIVYSTPARCFKILLEMRTASACLLGVPSLPTRAFNDARSSSTGESFKTQKTCFSIIRMQSEAELKSPHLQQGANVAGLSRRGTIGLGFSVGLLHLLENFSVQKQTAMAEGEDVCVLSTAPSGLAFCDRVVGTGVGATKGQLIKAHYVGKLENGKVFDSSYSRGKPLAFRVGVGEVIKGWDQGILGGDGIPPMLPGGKRTLKLPPELGYGMRGAGCKGGSCVIPPDSFLVFDVEFIGKA